MSELAEQTPEERIEHWQRRADSHIKGFILPGLTLIPTGIVAKYLGAEVTDIPSWVSASLGYGISLTGGIFTAVGFYERGFDHGIIAEIETQMHATTEMSEPQVLLDQAT